jgi:HAD superfamily hydrolase (TIGR01490 family)
MSALNAQLNSSLPVVAVFDFDGTFTRTDSLMPFLHMVSGTCKFFWGLFVLSPIFLGYVIRIYPNWQAKEWVLRWYLTGIAKTELQRLGDRFATQKLPKLIRPQALKQLQWHQLQGHKIILVSASLEIYLIPWATSIGIDYVLGTALEFSGGETTGCISGHNCYGQEKVNRLESLLGDLSQYTLYAYGDSRGDYELLNVAKYKYFRPFLS